MTPMLLEPPPLEAYRMQSRIQLEDYPEPILRIEGPEMGIAPLIAIAGRLLLPVGLTIGGLIGGKFLIEEGLGISLDASTVVPGVILGGLSAGAFVLSSVLPENLAPYSTLGGIALGVGSLIVFFAGSADAAEAQKAETPPVPVPPPQVPPGQEVPQTSPTLTPADLARLLPLTMDPAQPQTGGDTRTMVTAQKFQFSVRNDANRTLSFYAGISVFDSEQNLIFQTPTLQRKIFSLSSGQVVSWPDANLGMPAASKWITLPETMAVEVQLFREREEGVEFARTAPISIKFAFLG